MRLFSIFKEIVIHVVKGPSTRNYPAEKREPFPGVRGKLAIDGEKCIYCGACARKCPANAIQVKRQPEKEWRFERFRCILCGYCVEVCPKKCLFFTDRLEK
ncbi:MAG: NAD(P)H-quinone oxidoreductase subunit I [Lentisphaerae bacterium ADurb.Bin242]|nr:MAG: NAD(P)H-quinone oxidoreductase subunit I [Lentisphaerae bacterium ADurb.Bin242]